MASNGEIERGKPVAGAFPWAERLVSLRELALILAVHPRTVRRELERNSHFPRPVRGLGKRGGRASLVWVGREISDYVNRLVAERGHERIPG